MYPKSIHYRPEIDGLRAVAVFLVIFYHAGLSTPSIDWFPGGLIGVDVFFVISGYLITCIIQKDIENFSIRSFYERRIRRIIPALFLVIMATIPVAYFTLLPKPFYEYERSARSAVAFISNIYFWRLDSYTAEASQYKPLLHTWSLGVEEQFYILYPAIVVLIWRLFRRLLTTAIFFAFLGSFILMIWASEIRPEAAFFLLPTRAWELLAGALLARVEGKFGRPIGRNGILPIIGLATIVGSSVFLGDYLHAPGWSSLIPVISTCLVIWFCEPRDLATRLLSSRPFVWLGLISFSLYLWHQPVIVFTRISSPYPVGQWEVVVQLVGIILLSWLTWRFIEKPFREHLSENFGWAVALLIIVAVVINVATASLSNAKKKLEGQPVANMLIGGAQEVALKKDNQPCHGRSLEAVCRFGPKDAAERWYVVGDSHASVLSASLYETLQTRTNLMYVNLTTAGCHYAPGLYREKKDLDHCNHFSHQWREELLSAPPSTVVITGRLPLYLSGVGYDNGDGGIEPRKSIFLTSDPNGLLKLNQNNLIKILTKSLQELANHGHQLVLVYPVPEPGWNIPQHYAKLVEASHPNWGEGWNLYVLRAIYRTQQASIRCLRCCFRK